MNVDYSICHAVKYRTTEGVYEVLLAYDVLCGWIVNFRKRVEESEYLPLPEGVSIIGKVGKFHLAAHVKSCFPMFSLNFLFGAGQIDGEILEQLWSSLNKSSSSTRLMGKAHRREVLDDHMRDWNWKKLVGMGKNFSWEYLQFIAEVLFILLQVRLLLERYNKAIAGVKEMKPEFEDIDDGVSEELRAEWEEQERLAKELGGDHLEAYQVRMDLGQLGMLSSSPIRRYSFKN
jgi:hypothetical protein